MIVYRNILTKLINNVDPLYTGNIIMVSILNMKDFKQIFILLKYNIHFLSYIYLGARCQFFKFSESQ